MSWYATMPRNPLTVNDVDQRISLFLQSQSARGSYAPRSIPQISVDTPIVTALPLGAEDGSEVYLTVDATSHAVAHMIYLRSIPGWVQTGAAPLVTTLSATGPFEGFQAIYDAGDGIRWHLVYDTSDGSTYPWLFIGGPAMFAEVTTTESTTSATYTDLATSGPTITLPLAGDYFIAHSHTANTATANEFAIASPKLGAAATSDTNGAWHRAYGTSNQTSARSELLRTGLAASAAIKLQYRTVSGNTVNFENRVLSVRPKRVGA